MFNFRTFKCFADDTNVSGGGVTESPLEPRTRVEHFLNKIAEAVENSGGEGGGDGSSSSGVLVVNIIEKNDAKSGNTKGAPGFQLDKTASQIYSAATTTGCVAYHNGVVAQFECRYYEGLGYSFAPMFRDENLTFTAAKGDDYPTTA